MITFALLLGLLRQTVAQNFFVMATGLLMEFAWLMAAILLSLLIRLDGVQIKNGLRIYAPVMTVCFLVIAFRIILIPNTLVNLIFPPMLLVCAVWQWRVVKHYQKRLPKSDVFYTTMSLIVFVFSVIASLIGYTLLSVEALIWWTMQLTCILTITCLSSMLKGYGNDPRRLFFDKTRRSRAHGCSASSTMPCCLFPAHCPSFCRSIGLPTCLTSATLPSKSSACVWSTRRTSPSPSSRLYRW